MVVLECVPNLSEGRDRALIDRLEVAVAEVEGASLLDSSSDFDHHRTVLTIAGEQAPLEQAVESLAAEAFRSIDLATHRGIHPRLGALDVVPFVPLAGATVADAIDSARRVGAAFASRFGVPVFLYEHAARADYRRSLPSIRRGGPGALERRMTRPEWAPDFGGEAPHPTAGVAVVGARDFLIAFNVVLESADLDLARSIARRIRETDGGLASVRALGLALERRGLVQVSMNLLDFRKTSPSAAFARVRALAEEAGVGVREGEFVGLVPEAAIEGVEARDLGLEVVEPGMILEHALARAGLA